MGDGTPPDPAIVHTERPSWSVSVPPEKSCGATATEKDAVTGAFTASPTVTAKPSVSPLTLVPLVSSSRLGSEAPAGRATGVPLVWVQAYVTRSSRS